MKYLYSVMKFVPDAARAEFVNVGVLACSESGTECKVKLVRTRRRASHLADSKVIEAFWSYLQSFRLEVDTAIAAGEEGAFTDKWLHSLWEESGNLLQFSEPAPITADRLDSALAVVAEEFLIDSTRAKRTRGPTRATAQARVRRAYSSLGLELGRDFVEHPLVSGSNHKEIFDFAVANGRAVQLTQTWNFSVRDLPGLTEAVKAWAWTVRDVRETGGRAELGRRVFDVPNDVDVQAVYLDPTTRAGQAAFEEAVHAFHEVDAVPVPLKDVETLGSRAVSLLAG